MKYKLDCERQYGLITTITNLAVTSVMRPVNFKSIRSTVSSQCLSFKKILPTNVTWKRQTICTFGHCCLSAHACSYRLPFQHGDFVISSRITQPCHLRFVNVKTKRCPLQRPTELVGDGVLRPYAPLDVK